MKTDKAEDILSKIDKTPLTELKKHLGIKDIPLRAWKKEARGVSSVELVRKHRANHFS